MTETSAQLPLETQKEAPAHSADRVFFPTNRSNLLEAISSRLIGPVDTFDKYYDDLLKLAPGHVVLIAGSSDGGFADLAYDPEEAGSFPVLIELDPAAGPVEAGTTAIGLEAGPVTVTLVDGLVPLADATVHFRTQTELDEHRLNEYENVDHESIKYFVSPELFGPTDDLDGVTERLRATPPGPPIGDIYRKLDRISGACELAGSVLPRYPDAVEGFAAFLNRELPPPPVRERRGWPTWITTSALVDEGEKPKAGNPEARALRGFAAAFAATSPAEGLRPGEVVDAAHAHATSGRLGKADAAALSSAFETAKAVVTLDRDFAVDDQGISLSAVRGGVYALLRPEPTRLLRFLEEESPADEWSALTAAVLVGLYVGRRRLPTSTRVAALDRYLAQWMASTVNGTPTETVRAELPAAGSAGPATVVSSSETLIEAVIPPPALAELLSSADLSSGVAHEVALDLVRQLRWEECLRTKVILPDGNHSFGYDRRHKAQYIEFVGLARAERTLEVEAFLARLASSEIPEELELTLRGTLTGDPPAST